MAGADYIVTGSLICTGQHLRVLINLLVTATGEVLQSKSFERNILPPSIIEIQDEIFQNFIGFANSCYQSIIQENQKSGHLRH